MTELRMFVRFNRRMRTPATTLQRLASACATVVLMTGCAQVAEAVPAASTATRQVASAVTVSSFWKSTKVHTINVTFAKADFAKLLTAYRSTGTKIWMKATVKLDGRTFTNVGMRLKGNSSLRTLSALNGMTSFVIRSNVTSTSLNEAIALELIGAAGLETQRAIATKLVVNGSKPTLRLVIENPDDYWYAKTFSGAGLLYKAEAAGDYSYRGDTATAYIDVFVLETSKSA